jgi:exopolyphosphatase / guanosine-5'-triphosphate,3'-diphosphate pyrophosphatase
MAEYTTIAAVDLGSNSFHCQIARVDGSQTYPLDGLREPVRLGAGLDDDKMLDAASQARAIACLHRFSERLRSFRPKEVRALGTNTLRVAKNAAAFLKKAEAALGFPIEVIAGREEARLIYLGVSHSLPKSSEPRLVVDIGGGSTEVIIGEGYKPQRLDSLYMGCVSFTRQFFRDGKLTKNAFKQADIAARAELQHIVAGFSRRHWKRAVGSSGSARTLAHVLQLNGLNNRGAAGITPAGLERLRTQLIRAGDLDRIGLAGLREDRTVVLPGGLAIMSAVLTELDIARMDVAEGAMREGILYDMLGRSHHRDTRDATVTQFMQRYHVDVPQAKRVNQLALQLYERLAGNNARGAAYLDWAAKLHEIGISVAYSGYHRHSAYIISNADMPGFTRPEQHRLAQLVLAHRRSLKKELPELDDDTDWRMVFALRLAVLFCQRRSPIHPRIVSARASENRFRLAIDAHWLQRNPLTSTALREEIAEWAKIGVDVKIGGLESAGRAGGRAPA